MKICPLPIDVDSKELSRNKCEESTVEGIADNEKTVNKEKIVYKANLPKCNPSQAHSI